MRAVVVCIGLLVMGIGDAFGQGAAPDIAATPGAFDYETVAVGSVRERAFAVTNEGTADLVIFGTELEGAGASQFRIIGGGGGVLVAPGGTRLINIRFAPTIGGRHQAILRIDNNDPDENPLEISLSGTGQGTPNIAFSNAQLAFGNVALGTTRELDLLVTNTGTGDLEVTETLFAGADPAPFSLVTGGAPFTLAPQTGDTLTVRFSPTMLGAVSALLRVTSNDPDESTRDIVVQGAGVGPDIVADVPGLDFGSIAVSTSASLSFRILNQGSADLTVDSVAFLGQDADLFQANPGSVPAVVRAGGNRTVTVQYAPTRPGTHTATLRVFNNDPDSSLYDLGVQGMGGAPRLLLSAATLDFGEVLVSLDDTRNLTLSNAGEADLIVSQLVITGSDETEFALLTGAAPFTVPPSDSVVLQLRFLPASAGPKNTTLRLVTNDIDQPDVTIPLTGLAGTIQVDIAATAGLGEDVPLTVTIPRDFGIKRLLYRSAGAVFYRNADLTGTGPTYQGLIPGPVVTLSGVEYYIFLQDGAGQIVTHPLINAGAQPLVLPARIDQVEAPDSLAPRTFRMISVPLDLDDKGVEAVLGDDYGPYDTRRWRLFRWAEERDDYVEHPAIEEGFEVGVGFWLVTNDGAPFDVDNARSVAPREFTITLEPGWNQIGNPYSFPVGWPASLIDPRVERPAAFDGVDFQYGETILRPWEGYFVHNGASTPVEVPLSPVATASKAGTTGGVVAWHKQGEASLYTLRLSAEVEGLPLRDTQNYLGFAEEASEEQDAFDVSEAPPIGEYVRLSIVEDGARYAGNFKPMGGDGQHWDLEVDGTAAGKTIRIQLTDSAQLPEGYERYVLDQDRRQAIPVVEGRFTLDLDEISRARHLRILIGTKHYAERHRDDIALVPRSFALAQNYPNPFNPETTIRYQLGEQGPVRLEIFNLVGQRVRTLVAATQEAGAYTVRWDGHNDEGVAVASGAYLYRLQAGTHVSTRNMLLIR